MGFRLVPKSVI